MEKISIGIVGLGGVGGFYGGLLARHYKDSASVDINFVVRGKNYEQIKNNGLVVSSKTEHFTAYPAHIAQNCKQIGKLDYIILATKAYDLDALIAEMTPSIHEHTVVIPLLNGVEAYRELKQRLSCEVMQGCTYMVSRLSEPGFIENPSGRQKIYFGIEGEVSKQGEHLAKIMREAGVNAQYLSNINQQVWEKYVLVSASASATAYFNLSIGKVMDLHTGTIRSLVEEATAIARANEPKVLENLVDDVMEKLKAMPYESTTSMHSDFIGGKMQTELEVMTGYMVKEGKRIGILTPTYEYVYEYLQARQGEKYLL